MKYEPTAAHSPELGGAADRLLASVPERLRPAVCSLLGDRRSGGRGLRAWLGLAAGHGRAFPDALPPELVEVYLCDDDAEPLHDCEECGLAVPVRVARRGHEPIVERAYFPACPCCGARTGRHAFWSRAPRGN